MSLPATTDNIVLTSTEERAMKLLVAGHPQETVAATLGVTPSYISQLMSQEYFRNLVIQHKYTALASYNLRDSKYDELEDSLLQNLKESAALLVRPGEIAKVLSIVNSAKRRGVSTPENVVNAQQLVSLVMPTKIVQQFTTNINNLVIKAGEQDLVTMQSGTLLNTLKTKQAKQSSITKEVTNEPGRVGEFSSTGEPDI